MKIKTQLPTWPVLAALVALPAGAIEAPADDAPPPAAPQAAAEADAPDKLNPAGEAEAPRRDAFLGVVTSDLPEMLSHHLDLEAGRGVVVDSLMPDGPAAKAGLAVHDIITGVNGKAVGSPAELTAEIRGHQAGDAVNLQLVQRGKPGELEITLGVRPDGFGAARMQPLDRLPLDGMPNEMADRIRRMIEENLGGLNLLPEDVQPLDPGALPRVQGLNIEDFGDLQQRLGRAIEMNFDLKGGADGIEFHREANATIRMADAEGLVEVRSRGDSKEVTIRDKDNNVTWTGPWDTDQDKAAAPEDIRERIERLNLDADFKGGGLRLKMLPRPQPE